MDEGAEYPRPQMGRGCLLAEVVEAGEVEGQERGQAAEVAKVGIGEGDNCAVHIAS